MAKELIDKGFDTEFNSKRINDICRLFSSEDKLQDLIDDIHLEDNAIDMKRGEFYPEILRGIMSLKSAISNVYKIDPRQTHPNLGCNGCIDTILTAVKLREIYRDIDPSKEGGMLVSTPTYFRNYNSSASKNIRMIKIPLKKHTWDFDIDSMLSEMIERKPSVIFLVTPNNPTGMAISDKDILTIIEKAPLETLVVMDRTLVNIKNEINSIDLIKRFQHKQLAIMHSFSKYSGLSHLRVGFTLYSNINLGEEIRPLLPLGLPLEGVMKAITFLNKDGGLKPSKKILSYINKNKQILEKFCKQSSLFDCTDFVGNYCLLILNNELTSQTVESHLLINGIYVMGGHEFPEPVNHLVRIHTGGKPEYMIKTIEALQNI